MHSHDRTLLAKLGFADPDKRGSRDHDLACHYVTLPGNLPKLVSLTLPKSEEELFIRFDVTALEYPVSKGHNQYKVTIGFLDALLLYQLGKKADEKSEPYRVKDGIEFFYEQYALIIEVKIHQIPIGDILRQLHLYEEYLSFHSTTQGATRHYLVVTKWEPTAPELQMLANANIKHLKLSENFDKWMKSQEGGQKKAVCQEI